MLEPALLIAPECSNRFCKRQEIHWAKNECCLVKIYRRSIPRINLGGDGRVSISIEMSESNQSAYIIGLDIPRLFRTEIELLGPVSRSNCSNTAVVAK